MRNLRVFASILVLSCLAGCGRTVVLSPAEVAAHNAPDWTVRSPPGGAVPAFR